MSNSEKIIHLDTISSSTYLIPYVFLYAFFHLFANIDEIIGWLSVFLAVHSSAQFHSKIISLEYKTQKQYAHKPYFYYNIYIANTKSSFSIFILWIYSLIRNETSEFVYCERAHPAIIT